MKALFTSAVLALLIATATTVRAQDWQEGYLGLPGDNLNLYATMKLFQESETLEGFEMALNSEDTGINNLDLNGDRRVDYINVTDHIDGYVHNIVLSVALNKKHRQDVAVFIVERFRDGSAQIQLVGDEALYGRNYIVEPYYDNNTAETANPGYYGRPVKNVQVTVVTTSAWEVASWPLVHYIYLPGYMAWHSPWYWGYWPASWSTWDPWYWHYYYGYHSYWNDHYYAHFRHWNHVRYHGYNDFYYAGVRHWSKDIHKNISKGTYKEMYSRPELRQEGEALARVSYGRDLRTRNQRTDQNRLQSEVPEGARVRATRSNGTAAGRQSDVAVTTRSTSSTDAVRGTTASRRAGTVMTKSAATVTEPSGRTSSPARTTFDTGNSGTTSVGKPATTGRRSAGTGSTQPAQRPAPDNAIRNQRNSSNTASSVSRPAPQPVQRTTPAISTSRQYGASGSATQVYSGGTSSVTRSDAGNTSASSRPSRR